MTTTVALALDLSTKRVGWALYHVQDEEVLDRGQFTMPKGSVNRTHELARFLEDLRPRPTVVVYEQIVSRFPHAARALGNVEGAVFVALGTGRQFYNASPTEVKKRATGKGRADKSAMVEAANERWGLDLGEDDHDLADALCVLSYWVSEHVEVESGEQG